MAGIETWTIIVIRPEEGCNIFTLNNQFQNKSIVMEAFQILGTGNLKFKLNAAKKIAKLFEA